MLCCSGYSFARPPAESEPADADTLEAIEQPAPAATNSHDSAWWDNELRTAVAHVRTAHPDLAAALEQAHTLDETGRGEAYSQVIAWCMQPSDERRDRADIEALLTRWYAREPSDVAARQIPERLLAPARSLDDGLPHEVQTLSSAFWGCRTAARLWKDPDISAQRSAELAALLETAVREPLDRSLEATELENQCVAALARRYYAALPRTAAEHPIQTDPENSSHRWERLAGQADDVLRRTADEPNNPDILLQQALDRTYLATLACALAQGEEAAATFQELESQGPARLAIHAGPWPARPAEPFVTPYPVSSAMVIQQHIDSLADVREVEGRMTLLRLIANAADTLRDIDPESGQKLAAYLLQPKSDEEHRQLLSHVARLARWNAVSLGLADQLAEAAGSGSQRQDVLGSILGNDIPLNTAEDRRRARRQLLQTVLVKLSAAAETADARLRAIDQGSRAMRDLYCVQARLLRVPAETYASAQYPSAVLGAMISHLAGQLDTRQVTTEQRQLLDTLPNQLVAIDFVAENDLLYTTMLQRIWLQILDMYMAQRFPEKALAARGIVTETQESQASQDRVFVQLRDLEAGLLRLWMLYRPEEEVALPGAKDV